MPTMSDGAFVSGSPQTETSASRSPRNATRKCSTVVHFGSSMRLPTHSVVRGKTKLGVRQATLPVERRSPARTCLRPRSVAVSPLLMACEMGDGGAMPSWAPRRSSSTPEPLTASRSDPAAAAGAKGRFAHRSRRRHRPEKALPMIPMSKPKEARPTRRRQLTCSTGKSDRASPVQSTQANRIVTPKARMARR